ncbi:unnamed protein product [Phaedon cochleariae]|uniref:UDENN domain-containing protein n=1 Tax=Phaedon cochleariae TaxID=80249 RepID=A0A9P0GTV5_PHACE|nr:unnamed protein product [Phaedon cochleariae]
MYRPPQNSNRVKTIKSKFENIENNKPPEKNNAKNGYRNNLNSNRPLEKTEKPTESPLNKPILQRQLSDQSRRSNIKRTPAFRVDRSVERPSSFQRNCYNRSTLFENKVKQFSASKYSCDSNSNEDSETSDKKPLLVNEVKNVKTRPLLVKSKSSHDFQYIRSKFDRNTSNNNESEENQYELITNRNLENVDLSLLYTEPIPKALRIKNTVEIEEPAKLENQVKDIYSTSTLKISDLPPKNTDESLTDTLKIALKRPLPVGPAPKKPPRTFQVSNLEKNISFLHVSKQPEKKPQKVAKKADPKYMLNKLENALRNNKLKARRQAKVDISTTSGEDSDDSLLFRSKTNEKSTRTLPRLPSQDSDYQDTSAFNLNCLNGLRFAMTNYEKIKEPNSCFFVSSPEEEPVYAEPYHHRKDSLDSAIIRKREGSTSSKQSARNSLYYMSTPLLSEVSKLSNMNGSSSASPKQQIDVRLPDLKLNNSFTRQASGESSSLSSFTSDLDSTPSPMEESSKIRSIIECYETGHIDSANRVENLKVTLKQTLDTSFNYDSAMRDSDSENNENETKVSEIIRKFETYRQTMPKYCKPRSNRESLFYCCMIIEKVGDAAQIKFKYPSCVDIPEKLENLCFPESDSVPLDTTNTSQNYSLLITNDKGERMYGYCRRVLPEGSTRCLPLAYCILSIYRAPRFYKKILVELESRHGIPNKFRDELIREFYLKKFPKPGESIKINLTNIEPKTVKTENKENIEESVELVSYVHVNRTGEYISLDKQKSKNSEQIFINESDLKSSCAIPSYIVEYEESIELVLTLHPDTRYEDSDLKRLHQLPADVLLMIFSSMLLERKVILISSIISKLSSCVDSLQSILYPFTWHHTFIPILPEALWDIVESPTPVICGVLSKEVIDYHQIENGIVVDLDSGKVCMEEGDEMKIFSGSMQKVWRRSIALANKAAASMDYVHSVYLSDAYLQVFIMCFKDYKKFFLDGVFQKEDFIKQAKTKGIRRFLRMFTETYMFLAFLDTVLNTPENLVEFDKKIEMYGSEDSSVILDKLLEWNR